MKRILIIAAALLIGAGSFSAAGQLKIGETSEGAERLLTLSQLTRYLYRLGDHYYYVTITDNRFDDPIWLDLGDSPRSAAKTVYDLYQALENAKPRDRVNIESEGQPYVLVYEKMLGSPFFYINTGVGHQRPRAGSGGMEKPTLRKAYDYLRQLAQE